MQSEQKQLVTEHQENDLKDEVRDKHWFTASITCEDILKTIDPGLHKKAVQAGIEVANMVDDFSNYKELWEAWTGDMAVIGPSVLAELKQLREEGIEGFDTTFLISLLCRAAVIASSIVTLETRIEDSYINEHATIKTER